MLRAGQAGHSKLPLSKPETIKHCDAWSGASDLAHAICVRH
jgi:hypothetical protein